jgi:hypothetical protein
MPAAGPGTRPPLPLPLMAGGPGWMATSPLRTEIASLVSVLAATS